MCFLLILATLFAEFSEMQAFMGMWSFLIESRMWTFIILFKNYPLLVQTFIIIILSTRPRDFYDSM